MPLERQIESASAGPTVAGTPIPDGVSALRLLILGNAGSVHVRRWAAFFADRGHEVHVASLGVPDDEDSSGRFRVHRLGRPATAIRRVRSLVRRLGPDVVHAQYLTYYGWFARLSGRPYALTLWGSDILIDVPTSIVRRTWARFVLRGAAAVTADSLELVEAAVRLGAARERCRLIQFGVDTGRFAPGPAPRELADALGLAGRRVLFSPRAVAPLYRTACIVAAMAELPEDLVMVSTLAGADPAYHRQIADTVERRGLQDRVVLLASVPHAEMDGLYRLADVVVSVPASDGTPVSILEAMAVGRPVVASDLPSVRPLLEGIAGAFLVPVDDPIATAAAIGAALALGPEDRARIELASRAHVLDHADQAANMLRVEALYRDLARR